MNKFDAQMTAREVVQLLANPTGQEEIPIPDFCQEEAGSKPDAYTDGSMLNAEGIHLAIGGWGPSQGVVGIPIDV